MALPDITLNIGPKVADNEIGRRIADFAAAGLKYLSLEPKQLERMGNDPAYRKIMLTEAERNGISFRDAHAPHQLENSLGCPVPDGTRMVNESIAEAIDIAGDLGITTLTIHSARTRLINEFAEKYGVYPTAELAGARERSLRSLEYLVPLAEKRGVVLALENLFLISSVADVITPIVEEVAHPNLGMCYDSGHALLVESQPGKTSDDIAEWIRIGWDDSTVIFQGDQLDRMLAQVVTCHLHDNDGVNDRHWYPGDERGVADWQHIIERLKKAPRLITLQGELIGPLYDCSPAEIVSWFDMFKN